MQYFKIISLLIFTFMFLSCSKHPEDKIVARVGDEEITFSEFDMDFNLYPHYRQNSTMRNARLEQINYMIDRVYLKMAAQQEGLDKKPDITEKLDYIRYKEILKRLYEKNVLDSIHISDDDAWQEYKKSNIQVKMRHLFAKTKEQAEKYFQELQAGASFSELALSCFKDSILAHNGGDLGFLNITDLDPLLVDSVYNQRIGQFSKPLQSSYGYHIIRVDDIKQSVFLSKDYFEQNKDYYVNSLKTRRATRRSAAFVSEALKGKSVNINPKIFRRLLTINKRNVAIKQQEYPFTVPAVTDLELQKINDSITDLSDSVLVRFSNGQWTVGEFLNKLSQMPPLHRPVVNREKELVNRILDMVRDELLLQEAIREGIEQDPELKKNVSKWEKELLAEEYYRRIYWVDYQKLNREKWQDRKNLLADIKTKYPARIDTTLLFHNVTKEQLEKHLPKINITVREPYIW